MKIPFVGGAEEPCGEELILKEEMIRPSELSTDTKLSV